MHRRVIELLGLARAGSWAAPAVAAGLAGVVLVWLARPERGGDTGPLLTGTEALAQCLGALDLVDCEAYGPIDPFPALQHVPDLIAHALGLSEGGRVRVLAALSVAGVAAAVAAGWVTLRRVGCPEWRWAFLLVALTGPALAYGSTTWGEMLALGLVTLLVAATLVPAHPALVGLAALGAGLTKETGYPFVAALGLVSLLLAGRRTAKPVRRHVLFGAAGLALAVVAGSALNLIRFGTPRNAYYLDPGLRTTTLENLLELATGLLVAPNGGILLFWPLASLLVALLILAGSAVRAARGVTSWEAAWPTLALVAIVGGLVLGLAAWWAPFGWWAWGPRLSLPWVLPVLLVALAAFGSMLTPVAARVLRPRPVAAGAAVVAVGASLPHVGVLWRPRWWASSSSSARRPRARAEGRPRRRRTTTASTSRCGLGTRSSSTPWRGSGASAGSPPPSSCPWSSSGCLVCFRGEAARAVSTPRVP